MRLFDDLERVDLDHGKRTESPFSFLNRSARPEVAAVRSLLEEWFERFPEKGRAQVRGDFRASDPRQHLGAFWELYVHEVHRCLGYEMERDPAVPGSTRRVDFLARRGASAFYLEATVVTLSNQEMAAQNRWNALLDLIDDVSDPDFSVSVHVKVAGMDTPAKKEVVRPIEEWLASLDWAGLETATIPVELELSVRDWVLVLRAERKPSHGRGDPSFPTVWFTGVIRSRLDERQNLEDDLRDKSKYGELDLPLVVAVLCDRSLVTERLVEWALYGPLQVIAPIRGGVGRMEDAFLDRNPRGLWQRGAEPQVTRVSAVLAAMHAGPRTVATSNLTLWKNPWAARPLADDLPWQTVVGDLDQDRLVTVEGTRLPRDVLGIDPRWPAA